jgi:vacuolar-type H+-ATPase subunit I/STV1
MINKIASFIDRTYNIALHVMFFLGIIHMFISYSLYEKLEKAKEELAECKKITEEK